MFPCGTTQPWGVKNGSGSQWKCSHSGKEYHEPYLQNLSVILEQRCIPNVGNRFEELPLMSYNGLF